MAKSSFPSSSQVYKATGEEFLKIAGGQIFLFIYFFQLINFIFLTMFV